MNVGRQIYRNFIWTIGELLWWFSITFSNMEFLLESFVVYYIFCWTERLGDFVCFADLV